MPATFSAATIVGLGKFDPDLFRLDALVESKVISQGDGSRSKVLALLPKRIAHYSLSWGEILVLPDRFQTSVTEAPFIRAADLFVQAVTMAGDSCSLRAFGINFEAHFDLGSIEARDALAVKFAPPDAWGEWGRAIKASMVSGDVELHGGVAVQTMRERFRTADIRGWYDVTITSSEKVRNNTGVQFLTNHHHEYATAPTSEVSAAQRAKTQTAALLRALSAEFDNSIGKGERIFSEVLV